MTITQLHGIKAKSISPSTLPIVETEQIKHAKLFVIILPLLPIAYLPSAPSYLRTSLLLAAPLFLLNPPDMNIVLYHGGSLQSCQSQREGGDVLPVTLLDIKLEHLRGIERPVEGVEAPGHQQNKTPDP